MGVFTRPYESTSYTLRNYSLSSYLEDINKVKRHVKKQSADQPGGIVEIEKPLPVSSVVKKAEIKKQAKTTKKSISTKKLGGKAKKTTKKKK